MVILFMNTKGGVGKSVMAVHLLPWLEEQGREVTLVDTDPQGTAGAYAEAALPDIEVISENEPRRVVRTVQALSKASKDVVIDSSGEYTKLHPVLPRLADLAILPLQANEADLRELPKSLYHLRLSKNVRASKLLDVWIVFSKTAKANSAARSLRNELGQRGLNVAKRCIPHSRPLEDVILSEVAFSRRTKDLRKVAEDFDAVFSEVVGPHLKKRRAGRKRRVANG